EHQFNVDVGQTFQRVVGWPEISFRGPQAFDIVAENGMGRIESVFHSSVPILFFPMVVEAEDAAASFIPRSRAATARSSGRTPLGGVLRPRVRTQDGTGHNAAG